MIEKKPKGKLDGRKHPQSIEHGTIDSEVQIKQRIEQSFNKRNLADVNVERNAVTRNYM